MDAFWDESDDEFTPPPLTDEMVRSAESALGYRLPAAYLRILRVRNGGIPLRRCFPTSRPTSWAKDHMQITEIAGIGGDEGIDSPLGSAYLIREWQYPAIGIVVAHCPSAGHDVVMLDYTMCGPDGEPRVVHIDTEWEPNTLVLAPTFDAFLQGLVDCQRYDL